MAPPNSVGPVKPGMAGGGAVLAYPDEGQYHAAQNEGISYRSIQQ